MLRELIKKHFGVVFATLLALFLATEVVQTIIPSLQSNAVAQDEEGGGEEATTDGGTTPQAPPESMLGWTFKSLGWRYTITFLGISFAFVALLIMNMLS